MDNLTGKTLLLSSISKYFKNNPKHLEQFKNIILGKSFISLRLIDWLLTHFAKNNNIQYWIDDDNKKIFKTLPDNIKKAASLRKFNMYIDYRAQLKSFSKMYFDPFRRHERINYKISDKEIIETTIGQLNLFRWFFKNYIYEYIVNNYTEISKNMSSKNKNDKKTIEPIQQEIRYIKFN
jgi:hypothetical protein|tara:strand:+ start:348 stop:884 length:537 start_codon:yes stop_codon:yes gene_type:complete